MKIAAKDKATGREQSITIQPSGGLTKDEIDRMVKDAEASKAADKQKRVKHYKSYFKQAKIDAKNELDGALYKARQSFEEHKSKLDQATQDEILATFNESEQALNSDDVETMNAARSRIDSAAMKIGQAVYNQQQTTQQPEGQQQEKQEEGEEEKEKKEEGEKKN